MMMIERKDDEKHEYIRVVASVAYGTSRMNLIVEKNAHQYSQWYNSETQITIDMDTAQEIVDELQKLIDSYKRGS